MLNKNSPMQIIIMPIYCHFEIFSFKKATENATVTIGYIAVTATTIPVGPLKRAKRRAKIAIRSDKTAIKIHNQTDETILNPPLPCFFQSIKIANGKNKIAVQNKKAKRVCQGFPEKRASFSNNPHIPQKTIIKIIKNAIFKNLKR